MLQEAHALRARGLDVVVGLVETYGRRETDAQLKDFALGDFDTCVPPNIGGFTAGTPPIGGSGPSSHTAVLPLPSGFDDRSWKLGRTLGSPGS